MRVERKAEGGGRAWFSFPKRTRRERARGFFILFLVSLPVGRLTQIDSRWKRVKGSKKGRVQDTGVFDTGKQTPNEGVGRLSTYSTGHLSDVDMYQ